MIRALNLTKFYELPLTGLSQQNSFDFSLIQPSLWQHYLRGILSYSDTKKIWPPKNTMETLQKGCFLTYFDLLIPNLTLVWSKLTCSTNIKLVVFGCP